jgi:hypothetical protein
MLAEFVIIFLASLTIGLIGYPEAINRIVGIHVFPFTSSFDIKPYRRTAIALCAVAVTGGRLLAVAVRAIVELGAAAVLWASAVCASQTA